MKQTLDPLKLLAVSALTIALLFAAPAVVTAADDVSVERAARSAKQDLERSLRELSELRESIAAEKLPLNRRLRELESRLVELRGDLGDVNRQLDSGNLDLNNFRTEIKARDDERGYLANLLDEYVRNFETRIHITELQRYREPIERARLAADDTGLDPVEIYRTQAELVDLSLDRLLELGGGATFDGTAVAADGEVKQVTFAVVGPIALYSATDGSGAGLAQQRIGSLEPSMVGVDDPAFVPEVQAIVSSGAGRMPFDPTLGNARKMEATNDTIREHIAKGGPVMVPILVLAAAALIVAIIKWFQLARIRNPSRRRVDPLLEAVKRGDVKQARALTERISGPTGVMLQAGVDAITEPKELIEEIMFEKMLETRLRLQSFLSFIAVSAASAPLLGLLGTVTGIINTFKLITVFGTGDAKTLSGGISEALITTEFGLIVAIPSLLLHAYLSRKARRLIDGMEKTAVAFLNRIAPRALEVGSIESGSAEERDTGGVGTVGADPAPALAGGWQPASEVVDH